MNWWVLVAVVGLFLLGFIAYRLGWIDLSDKTRKRKGSSSSSIVGIGDEVFAPTRHEAQIEMDRQSLLPAPAPLAGDGDKGIFDGKITITMNRRGDASTRGASDTSTRGGSDASTRGASDASTRGASDTPAHRASDAPGHRTGGAPMHRATGGQR